MGSGLDGLDNSDTQAWMNTRFPEGRNYHYVDTKNITSKGKTP